MRNTHRLPPIALALALLLLPACQSQPDPEPDIGFEERDFPDAIRLTNGTVNLIVVPSIGGRIMRFGFVGGPNVLWNNPDVRRAAEAATTRPDLYVNYGGDKAWPWPQDQWPLLLGRTYPPPAEADQVPFTSRLIGSHGVLLESPTIPSHGIRIVRQIMLSPTGAGVTIVTRLEQATADRPPPELASWSVTQIPGSAKIYARLREGGLVRPMAIAPSAPTTRPIGSADNSRVIAIAPSLPRAGKLGLDADVLACAVGDTLFIQRSPTAAEFSPGYRAAERAQVFFQQADKPRPTAPRYAELEFTSPRQDLASGVAAELRVTWEVHRRADETPWTDKDVAAALAAGTPEPANRFLPSGVP